MRNLFSGGRFARHLLWTLGLLALLTLMAFSKPLLTRQFQSIFAVIKAVMLQYVDEPDASKLAESAVKGILSQLDPYAAYYTEDSKEEFDLLTTGGYSGVGAVIQQSDDRVVVGLLYENAPAAKAGLRVGDTIVSIDGVDLKDFTVTQVSEKLRGKAGSTIRVTVNRPYEKGLKTFSVKRQNVHMPAVKYATRLSNDVAYVNLASYTSGAAKEVLKAIEQIDSNREQPIKGVILDLRGNAGGLLSEAVDLVSLFVPPGNQVVEVRGRDSTARTQMRTSGNTPYEDLPLAILVDRESASSSEVTAGALQDLDRAIIIGARTFGKGLVQNVFPLPHGGVFKLTTAKYYTPSGRCIQALDYSHRDESGAVGYVPDSLVSRFQTRNGRTVYDGGGIWPDIPLRENKFNLFVSTLYMNGSIRGFATKYRQNHPTIAPAEEFQVTSETMRDFKRYLLEHGQDDKTAMAEILRRIPPMAEGVPQLEVVQPYIDSAVRKLRSSFGEFFEKNAKQIASMLSSEIASRYYYEAGRIGQMLQYDRMIDSAQSILMDTARMHRIFREVSPPDRRSEYAQHQQSSSD